MDSFYEEGILFNTIPFLYIVIVNNFIKNYTFMR